MDIQEHWERALKNTEIVRPRVQPLLTFASTQLPYIFLAESSVNQGDSVIRKGEVLVEKPSLVLPSDFPLLEGFELEDQSRLYQSMLTDFLFVRGVRFPSLKYNNKTHSLDIHEGKLTAAIEHFSKILQREENVSTGLIIGPEDSWQFSILIFICMQVQRSAATDIQRLLEDYRKKQKE